MSHAIQEPVVPKGGIIAAAALVCQSAETCAASDESCRVTACTRRTRHACASRGDVKTCSILSPITRASSSSMAARAIGGSVCATLSVCGTSMHASA